MINEVQLTAAFHHYAETLYEAQRVLYDASCVGLEHNSEATFSDWAGLTEGQRDKWIRLLCQVTTIPLAAGLSIANDSEAT